MFAFLKGTFVHEDTTSVYVEVAGHGYQILMSARDKEHLPTKGSDIVVYTHLSVREDTLVLFGFLDEQAKHMFKRLITVSGIGPTSALAALGTFTPKELATALAHEDVTQLSKIPGVGKKTAQRMILELKGELGNFDLSHEHLVPYHKTRERVCVQESLESMGFSLAEIEAALKDIPGQIQSEEEILRYALRHLG